MLTGAKVQKVISQHDLKILFNREWQRYRAKNNLKGDGGKVVNGITNEGSNNYDLAVKEENVYYE